LVRVRVRVGSEMSTSKPRESISQRKAALTSPSSRKQFLLCR